MRLAQLTLFCALLAGCSSASRDAQKSPMVRVITVGDTAGGGVLTGETLTGTVAARIESSLAFREGGRIIDRRVDNGAPVSAGTLLARIDPSDLAEGALAARAEAAAATRAVEAAMATAERAASDLRRLEGLGDVGAISRSTYDAAVENERAATARLAAARAQAESAGAAARVAGNRRGYAELRADAAGVITAVLGEPGQVVAPGTPIVRLAHAGPRDVVLAIPEQQRTAVPRSATGLLYGGGDVRLELRELAAAADPVTRTYTARYRILGSEPPLGATVTVRFAPSSIAAAHTVPIAAIAEKGRGTGVWVVGGDSKVAWRPVRLVALDGERALVTGLAVGERVVALGAQLLQPGQAVRFAKAGTSVGDL